MCVHVYVCIAHHMTLHTHPHHVTLCDTRMQVRQALTADAKKDGIQDTPDSMFAYLVERVRNNLHVILCMSPVGEPFRNCLRMFPAYVNCTTIDWFSEWPKDALLEVAMKGLEDVQLASGGQEVTELQKNVATVFVTMHRSVVEMSERMLFEMKRHNYVTPTNYLELVSGYKLYVPICIPPYCILNTLFAAYICTYVHACSVHCRCM